MSFSKLLEDLEALSTGSVTKEGDTVAKAMAADGDDAVAGKDDDESGEAGGDADDAAIAAAAADGEGAGAAADEDGDEPLGKSLKIVNESGEEEEAIDATDLLKSLVERVEGNETDVHKALTIVTDLVKSQAAEIGALRGQVTKLASAGRGRRTVVSVAEKPALSKAIGEGGEGGEGGEEPEGMPANEFMAKAMEACTAGKITGLDVSRAEAYINRGLDVPATIKAKVFG